MKWFVGLVLLIFVIRPAGTLYYEFKRLSATINAELTQGLVDHQIYISDFSAKTSPFAEVFKKLTCEAGPDMAIKMDQMITYHVNVSGSTISLKAESLPMVPDSLNERGWRKRLAARLMPNQIKVCDTCTVTREYAFAIDQWRVEKPIEPLVTFERHAARDGTIINLSRAEWNKTPINALVLWGDNSFKEVGEYVNRKFTGFDWVTTGHADLVAMQTYTPFCIYNWPDLDLVARKMVVTQPPRTSADFPREKPLGLAKNQIAVLPNYGSIARDVARAFSEP